MVVARCDSSLFDAVEVTRAVDLLTEPGGIFELRALDAIVQGSWRQGTVSGYFDSAEALIRVLEQIASARGIYITLNPINRALHARCCNRLRMLGNKEPVTSDHDVLCRRWLPVDCDAVRPSGISSNDTEHEMALERAALIRATLSSQGWPEPLYADSGNGGHLLYRIERLRDAAAIQQCLAALAARFDDDFVSVDQSVHNPARIWRLYGTRACKGDHTPTRPHRLSRIIDAPPIQIVR